MERKTKVNALHTKTRGGDGKKDQSKCTSYKNKGWLWKERPK